MFVDDVPFMLSSQNFWTKYSFGLDAKATNEILRQKLVRALKVN